MAQLNSSTTDILNRLFREGGILKTYGFRPDAIQEDLGEWLSDLYDAATGVSLPISGDFYFQKEANHILYVDASTTSNANGGNLTVRAGNAQGSGTDGVLKLGDANTSGVEMAVSGITTTVKGPLQVDETVSLNGNATIGNASTDTLTLTAQISGNVSLVKESNHTVSVAASTTSNTAGADLTVAAGAGVGSGNGGAAALVGGAAGATGTGGATSLTGGAGGATSGAGGAVSVTGGAGTNGNANGGAVSVNGGAKNGSGADGAVNIGTTRGDVNIGKSGGKIGLFGATAVVQPATTGTSTGFTAGSGTAVKDDSTFTGGTGSTAYRISDIVLALKQLGILTA